MKTKYFAASTLSSLILLIGVFWPKWCLISFLGWVPLFFILWDESMNACRLFLFATLAAAFHFGFLIHWILLYSIPAFLTTLCMIAPLTGFYFFLLKFWAGRQKSDFSTIATSGVLWIPFYKLFSLNPIFRLALDVPFLGLQQFYEVANITSFALVGALALSFNSSFALFLKKRGFLSSSLVLILVTCLGFIFLAGQNRLNCIPENSNKKISVALIQHNLPFDGLWRLDHPNEIKNGYRKLAREAAKQKPNLIVFPLYTFPEDILRQPDFFSAIARETHAHILVASHIPKIPGGSILKDGFMNVALIFTPDGSLAGTYQSVTRVPFSEVREYTSDDYKVIQTAIGNFGIFLCYEDTIPGLAKHAVRDGAEILIALSNPGLFSSTHLPNYHLIQDQFRAIESNRTVLRASANGFSAVINQYGKMLNQTQLSRETIIFSEVSLGSQMSVRHKYPDFIFFLSILCLTALLICFKVKSAGKT